MAVQKVVKKSLGKVGKHESGVSVGELPYTAVKLLRLGFNDLRIVVNAEGMVVLEAKKLLHVRNLLGDLVELEEL